MSGRCPTGKIVYRSPQEAQTFWTKRHRHRQRPLQTYKCEFCAAWHLGSNERAVLRQRDFINKKNRLSLLPLDPDEY